MKKNDSFASLLKQLFSNKLLFTFCLLIGVTFNGFGQTDNCNGGAAAGEVTVGTSCNITAWNSTTNGDYWDSASGGSCGESDNDDLWGWFIATSNVTTITYDPTGNDQAILTLFTGGCSTTMTSLTCADSGNTNGNPATILNYSTTVGVQYKFRIQKANGNLDQSMNGNICVFSPAPICNAPTTTAATGITSNSANINWNPAAPVPSNGYQYVVSTNNTAPAGAGTVGVSGLTVNSLTPSTTYYVFVRSNCGFGFSTWSGPIPFNTLAAPSTPPNDECSAAIGLTVNPDLNCGIMTAGSNVGATASPQGDVPDVTGNPDDDVWFSFVATNTQHVVSLENIVTVSGLGGLGIAIYNGGTSVDCNALVFQSDSSAESINLSGITIGNTYIVRVYGMATVASGFSEQSNFNVCVGTPVPPANDECSGAIAVTVNPDQNCTLLTPGTLNYATDSGINSGCSGNDDDDVWFTFQATGPSHTIDLLNNSSSTNLDFTVYANNPCSGSDTPLLCSPAVSNTVSGLTAGNTYYVQVYSNASTPQISNFNVCIGSPLINDEPCGAIALTPGTSCIATNSNSTGSTPTIVTPSNLAGCGSHDGTENDVWFSTVVSATGALQIDAFDLATSPDMDPVIAIYSGTCNGALTLLDCDDDGGAGLDAQLLLFSLTPGTTIFIRVWDYDGGQDGEFDICVTEVTNPCNNITPIANCGATPINATIPSGNGAFNDDACWDVPGQEVMYSFTPTVTGNYSITQISTFNNEHINYLYSDRCDATGWTCIDDMTSNGTTSTFPMNAGTTYYIMLDTENSTGGNVSFSLNCPPPPPVCGGTFTDSGGVSGNYSNNEYEITTILPTNAGDLVTVTFTFFDTESCCDDLSIYDGPDATYPLIGTLAGNPTLPLSFTSSNSSGALTFVFDSDISAVGGGWIADVTCTNPPPSCGDSFYDSGDDTSNYSFNENITTTISPDNAGEAVTVTFNAFNTEATNDVLLVYDGPDATAPLIATLSGDLTGSLPGPYTSTDPSGELTFVFTSNGSINQSGWDADVTCDCTLTITETLNPNGADACSLNYAQLVATTSSTGPGNMIFSEYFDTATMPVGWNVTNATANTYWRINNSSNAGGTANEAELYWNTGFDSGDWILASPLINISGATNLQLDYRYALNHWSSSYPYSVYVETSTDNATWTIRHSVINNSADISATTMSHDISSHDGNTNLYVRFRFTGESFGFFTWSIDNVEITGVTTPVSPQITWLPLAGLYTDAALTTAYTGGFTDTVYAAPNGTQTYTATDQNGCFGTATVTRNKKVWMGYTDNNWYNASNWLPIGVPDVDDCVLIPDVAISNVDSPIASEAVALTTIPLPPLTAYALNLTVAQTATLEIASDTELVVTDFINLNGTLNIRSTGSLVQGPYGGANNNIGSGIMNMERTVPGGIAPSDYIYWSSPTDEDFDVTAISTGTGELIYEWLPTTVNPDGDYGNWIPASGTMLEGKGYIVRSLSQPSTTAIFSGMPNNGVITTQITRGATVTGYTNANGVLVTPNDDNWNLLGNPYPSAISAVDFIVANSSIIDDDTAATTGAVYLWNHYGLPNSLTDPFYGDFSYNYNAGDYTTYNATGGTQSSFNGYIAAGQAFFVLMEDVSSPANVTFNNNMRSAAHDNSQFLRTNASSNPSLLDIEKHRIWLDLIKPNNTATPILVGYIEGATNNKERIFDAIELNETSTRFYSLIDEEKMAIQGRALPFDETDMVPLGLVIPQSGNYTIAINTIDGLFDSTEQDIFLEDTYNGLIHDLRIAPYSFNTDAGTFDDRFILRYTNNALSITEETALNGLLISAPNSQYIKVTSKTEPIKSIVVFDLLGRTLFNKQNMNETEFIINDIKFSDGTYIVKATLNNGRQKTQKVVLKQ